MSAAAAHVRTDPPGRLPRLLGGLHAEDRAVSLELHLRRYGPLPLADDLAGVVEQSDLRGRGGAGFPTARKLAAVAAARGRPVVVVNAAEGEPASGKDKMLLRYTPHLVLDGAAAAAAAVGARDAIEAVSARAADERARVEDALAERTRRRLDPVKFRVVPVPEAFVTGEETALLRALAGKPAKPATKPPYPFQRGLDGRPTLVQNAETLAHLALVARFGARWFREAGAPDAPGTALVTLSGAFARPGVHEIELGWTLDDLLRRSGGATEPVSAFLVGGYFGGWVAATDAAAFRLTPESLGAGAVVAFPADACAMAECARIVSYLAGESAGQCGPCVHGLAALANGFELIVRGDRRGNRAQIERWAAMIAGRGACRHPDGATRFAQSSLQTFAGELDQHLRHGRCGRTVRPVLPLGRRRAR